MGDRCEKTIALTGGVTGETRCVLDRDHEGAHYARIAERDTYVHFADTETTFHAPIFGETRSNGPKVEDDMGDVIELRDIHGNVVRVYVSEAVAKLGDMLRDNESMFIPRTKEPRRYVQVRIADDSEVPG